jgi:FixJ family two-component response regulator
METILLVEDEEQVTDMVMPGINGPVPAKTLQPRNPKLRMIFMSGHTNTNILPREMLAEVERRRLDRECDF